VVGGYLVVDDTVVEKPYAQLLSGAGVGVVEQAWKGDLCKLDALSRQQIWINKYRRIARTSRGGQQDRPIRYGRWQGFEWLRKFCYGVLHTSLMAKTKKLNKTQQK
jgi:hypothetical protein